MEKITSFTIDHIKLQPGVYVSRKDQVGESMITTFDLRMTSPNEEPVMNTAEVHTIEHLAATFLRNHKTFGSKTIYAALLATIGFVSGFLTTKQQLFQNSCQWSKSISDGAQARFMDSHD